MPIASNVDALAGNDTFGIGTTEDDVSSQIDGVTQSFVTTSAFDTGSLVIYWNGVRQRTGVEITVVNARTFTTQFTAPIGSVLVAVYKSI